MPKSFQPLSFHLQIVLFFVVFEPPGGAKTTLRERGHLKKSPSSTTCVLSTQRFWWGSRKLTPSRDVCTACVCTRSASLCVCMTIWLWNIHPKERRKKTRSRLSFFFSPHRLVYTRESLWKTGRERDDVAHTVDDEEKKKIFLKIWNKKKELCLLQACWNSLPSSFACRTRAEAQKKEERFCSPFRMVTGFFFLYFESFLDILFRFEYLLMFFFYLCRIEEAKRKPRWLLGL